MSTNLKAIVFEIKHSKLVSLTEDKAKLAEMEQIAEKVEDLQLQRFCNCRFTIFNREKFIVLFKSLNWDSTSKDTYQNLLDRLYGKECYIIPEIVDLTEGAPV